MRSRQRSIAAAVAGAVVFFFGHGAAANMSYTPWVHELNQVGQDVEVTVQVFEESDVLLGEDEIPMPGFDSQYTLVRWSAGSGDVVLLEDHVFAPEDAFEVTEFECHTWNIWYDDGCSDPAWCDDCDGDDVLECYGFCAVAYRFLVVDHCVPPGDAMYGIRTPECHSVWAEGEGLGFTNTGIEDTGDACLDDDSGCSVSGVGGDAGVGAVTGAILVLLGIVALARSRKRSH